MRRITEFLYGEYFSTMRAISLGFLTFFFAGFSPVAVAQRWGHELSVGWGLTQIATGFPGGLNERTGSPLVMVRSVWSPGESDAFSGPITVSYAKRLSRRWWLGAAVSHMRIHARGTYLTHNSSIEPLDEHQYRRTCFAAETKCNYIMRGMFKVYARFALGLDNARHAYRFQGASFLRHYDSLQPTVQISPLGVSYGRTVSGFAELGVGYRGTVSIGASYRFAE